MLPFHPGLQLRSCISIHTDPFSLFTLIQAQPAALPPPQRTILTPHFPSRALAWGHSA